MTWCENKIQLPIQLVLSLDGLSLTVSCTRPFWTCPTFIEKDRKMDMSKDLSSTPLALSNYPILWFKCKTHNQDNWTSPKSRTSAAKLLVTDDEIING